jgi:MFS family permease
VGILSDKYGKKNTFFWGLFFFAMTYAGMAFAHDMWHFFILFFIYALFGSCNEGVVKAWISNLCQKEDLATAIGFQATTQSMASMGASLIAGLVWYKFGAPSVFLMSSLVTLFVLAFFSRLK